MSRRNAIALGILIIGLIIGYSYDPVEGALICIIAAQYSE